MHAIKKGYVDTSSGQIHYREVGTGPAVMFMHQAGRTGAIYYRLGQYLAPHYRSIMVDLPGFGESDPLPLPFTVADIVGVCVELLDGLGIDHVRLSGHHTGAVVAGELAVLHPERVTAFAPTGYPLYLSAEERRQVREEQQPQPVYQLGGHSVPVAPVLQSDGSHLLRLFQRAQAMLWYSKVSLGQTSRQIILPFENLDDDDLAFINDYVSDGLRAISATGTLSAVRRYSAEERLPLLQVPTLFIQSTGTIEASFCQRAVSLQKLVPGSETADIENGDIHVMHTRPSDLGAVLLAFFSGIDRKKSAPE